MRYLFLVTFCVQLIGCSQGSVRDLWKKQSSGLDQEIIVGERFHHRVFKQLDNSSQTACLRIYIEGDGTPWESPRRVAADPSPRKATLLEIMKQDSGHSVYLGRPCYFGLLESDQCVPEDWTFGRFSDEVVTSMLTASLRLKKRYGAEKLAFIGHSGGGVLATLLAHRMPGQQVVLTISAPLDIKAWTDYHSYTPLFLSLNPTELMSYHQDIEQHWVSQLDENVPPTLLNRYFIANPRAKKINIEGMRHDLSSRSYKAWAMLLNQSLEEQGCSN